MPNCAVFGCNSYSRKTEGTSVKYYTFPKNDDLARQWLHACSRKDKINLKNARICSLHFNEDCFFKPLKHSLLQYSPKYFRNLKSDAVPTLNLPKSKNVADSMATARWRRTQSKEKKILVKEALDTATKCATTDVNKAFLNENNTNVMGTDNVVEGIETQQNFLGWEHQLKTFQEENKKLNEEIKKLQEKNTILEAENATLHNKLKSVKDVEDEVQRLLGQIFSPGPIRVLLNRNKKIYWNNEDISCAISLRSVSAKAYRYLRNKLKYPLPSLSSLRRWVSSLECQTGILKEVLLLMEHNGRSFNDFEKLTALSFDEMSLSKQICFQRKQERIFGPHSHAQVVMARGLTGKWKQPIFFDFDKAMNKDTLLDIIKAVENVGFKVISITSDLGGQNRSLWRELNVSHTKNSFPNPSDETRQVFVFADPPHLLKLARNHFVEKGFLVGDVKHITKACLEEMLFKQTSDLKVAFKLCNEQLYPKNKQNVKLAVQLFSNTNANAIRFYGRKGEVTGFWKETADVVQIFNDWFDVFNSSVPYTTHKEKCAFGIHFEDQKKILENMSQFINDSLVFGHKKILPFQKGILLTNKSLLDLYSYLKESHNIKYVITAKLNQDILENFFSCIRSMGRTNDHPDALQFIYRMRWFLMGRHSTTIMTVKRYIKPDTEECLTASDIHSIRTFGTTESEECQTAKLFRPLIRNCDFTIDEEDESSFLEEDDCNINEGEEKDVMKSEGLRYLTGYIAYKLQSKFPDLGIKTKEILKKNDQFSWIETVSKGGLRVPSDVFYECAKIVEECFNEFHEETDLRRESDVIKKAKNIVYNKIKDRNIPE